MHSEIRTGDLVEVRTATEILSGLDSNGMLDGLPFMPEMMEFCQRRYRVHQRVVQVTIDGLGIPMFGEALVREFRNNDVLLLEDLRCSGRDHGECQRGCMIFWKDAWLKKVEEAGNQSGSDSEGKDHLRSLLNTSQGPGVYFCQSSEIHKATTPLSYPQRIGKIYSAVRCGNCSTMEMLKRLIVWSRWKAHHELIGAYPRGNRKPTPKESLNLQPGEMVEVKSLPEIIETLDKNGLNRGLHFSADMIRFCGRRYRVISRSDRVITEATGVMRGLADTVILEGVTCDGTTFAFGGDPRMDFEYWREIWLTRV